MRIGELSRSSGTSIETIRYYERAGLLPAPARSEGNYRLYSAAHAERLGFIRQCRHLDMTLDEVRVLLRFRDAPQADCGEVNDLLDAHIGRVTLRIRQLRALETALRGLRRQCVTPHAEAGCGIVQGIAEAAGQERAPAHLRSRP